jgi:hypothetical protein
MDENTEELFNKLKERYMRESSIFNKTVTECMIRGMDTGQTLAMLCKILMEVNEAMENELVNVISNSATPIIFVKK